MKNEHEELVREYINEWVSRNHFELDHSDVEKVITVFFECGRQWNNDPTITIEEVAESLELGPLGDQLLKLVSDIWTKVYFE